MHMHTYLRSSSSVAPVVRLAGVRSIAERGGEASCQSSDPAMANAGGEAEDAAGFEEGKEGGWRAGERK